MIRGQLIWKAFLTLNFEPHDLDEEGRPFRVKAGCLNSSSLCYPGKRKARFYIHFCIVVVSPQKYQLIKEQIVIYLSCICLFFKVNCTS